MSLVVPCGLAVSARLECSVWLEMMTSVDELRLVTRSAALHHAVRVAPAIMAGRPTTCGLVPLVGHRLQSDQPVCYLGFILGGICVGYTTAEHSRV
jgi:hypothetical protein